MTPCATAFWPAESASGPCCCWRPAACAAAMGYMYGWASPVFTISAVVAIVVMYDAANVRKAAGEQAKILNYIMEHWTEMKPAIFGKELKEFLGHTPFQVLMGGRLGISVGLLGAWLWT